VMFVLRLGALPHSWCMVGLLLAACGEEKSPRDQTPELPAGTVELDPNDVAQNDVEGRNGERQRPDPERDVTGLPREAAPTDEAYQALLEAQDRELRLLCGCAFEEYGQSSAEECFEVWRRPDFARGCELAAFSLTSRELGPRYACLADARSRSATCLEERGCAGRSECETARNVARSACGGLVSADLTFAEFDDGCQRLFRLGSPSGCPDVAAAGSALGARVFRGNTTGAGDDVTLSCHWDFEGFESADLLVEWQAPAAGVYRFSTENSAFSTQIGILDSCAGAELACGTSDGSSFGGASLALSLQAQQSVVVVLEGYSLLNSGYVVLNVESLE